ncbi:MAG TPA: saccharopine dehydrogenase [Ignavibacteria bacterium]|nr:saccharopine dehydrogenase [Ignavibacteria bacterium]
MNSIIVLGAGMVGRTIAIDLHSRFDVTVVDINHKHLEILSKNYSIKTVHGNLSSEEFIKKIVKNYDLVIDAVPGFMGFNTLKAVIESGKNIVDISFFSEEPSELEELAIQKNVIAIIDCGVAPGLSNIIIGYHNKIMKINSFEILVGGLPVKRTLPFQYKAPFSPVDVIEEYIRPARLVENGKIVTKPALTDAELINIDPVGTLEAFNTDGLRTLLHTMKIPNMKEKTLRYPGHREYIKVLKDTGFFDQNSIEINGVQIKPIELSSKLLFNEWKLENDEQEFTVMRIVLEGEENDQYKKYEYILFDKSDEKNKISSMARTTGFTCTAVAKLILFKHYLSKGISYPEFIGAYNNCFDLLIKDLKEHNISINKKVFYQ